MFDWSDQCEVYLQIASRGHGTSMKCYLGALLGPPDVITITKVKEANDISYHKGCIYDQLRINWQTVLTYQGEPIILPEVLHVWMFEKSLARKLVYTGRVYTNIVVVYGHSMVIQPTVATMPVQDTLRRRFAKTPSAPELALVEPPRKRKESLGIQMTGGPVHQEPFPVDRSHFGSSFRRAEEGRRSFKTKPESSPLDSVRENETEIQPLETDIPDVSTSVRFECWNCSKPSYIRKGNTTVQCWNCGERTHVQGHSETKQTELETIKL